jgi:hypothetical protein
MDILRKPQARRYRYFRSGALAYAPVRRGRGLGRPHPAGLAPRRADRQNSSPMGETAALT